MRVLALAAVLLVGCATTEATMGVKSAEASGQTFKGVVVKVSTGDLFKRQGYEDRFVAEFAKREIHAESYMRLFPLADNDTLTPAKVAEAMQRARCDTVLYVGVDEKTVTVTKSAGATYGSAQGQATATQYGNVTAVQGSATSQAHSVGHSEAEDVTKTSGFEITLAAFVSGKALWVAQAKGNPDAMADDIAEQISATSFFPGSLVKPPPPPTPFQFNLPPASKSDSGG